MAATDIEAYRNMIAKLIEIRSPTRIHNQGPDHAKVILRAMFDAAKETAFVFCGCVSALVWDDEALIGSIKKANEEKNVDVKFLVQHEASEGSATKLVEYLKEKKLYIQNGAFATINPHFAVFDGTMYRIESNDGSKTATVCMNDAEMAGQLREFARRMINFAV